MTGDFKKRPCRDTQKRKIFNNRNKNWNNEIIANKCQGFPRVISLRRGKEGFSLTAFIGSLDLPTNTVC
jgi:hypothetical protein